MKFTFKCHSEQRPNDEDLIVCLRGDPDDKNIDGAMSLRLRDEKYHQIQNGKAYWVEITPKEASL